MQQQLAMHQTVTRWRRGAHRTWVRIGILAVALTVMATPSSADGQSACAPPIPALLARHTRNWSRIYTAPLIRTGSKVRLGALTPLSTRSGYNAQPAFSDDGKGVYYSWRPDSSQADIWYTELGTRKEHAVTCTSEEEYSPAPDPTRRAITVVRVENDSVRRLWSLPLASGAATPLLERVTTVAYFVWGNARTLALYLTDSLAASGSVLALADVASGRVERVAAGIGATLASVPGRRAVSYTDILGGRGARVMTIDLRTRAKGFVAELPDSLADYAWLPDGSLIAGDGSRIVRWTKETGAWTSIGDLGTVATAGVLHVVVDRRGDQVAIVVRER